MISQKMAVDVGCIRLVPCLTSFFMTRKGSKRIVQHCSKENLNPIFFSILKLIPLGESLISVSFRFLRYALILNV